MVPPLVAGLIGGLAGTMAMTAIMMPMMRGAPSGTQVLWSKIRHVDPLGREAMGVGMMLHFGYGAVWGGVLGLALDSGVLTGPPWLWGIGLGVVLMMLAAVLIMPSLGMKPPPGQAGKMMAGMMIAHLVYGAVTGLVFGLLW